MTMKIAHLNISDPAVKAALRAIATDLASLAGATGGEVTVASLKTSLNALVADLAAFATAHNATGTALNASDATDTDYVTNLAKTAVAVAADTAAGLNTTATAVAADLATFVAAFNTMSTKLNADTAVTDTDYATNAAETTSAPVSNALSHIHATVLQAIVDLGALRTKFNTRQTKLAADVTGTYSALAALTAANPVISQPVSLTVDPV